MKAMIRQGSISMTLVALMPLALPASLAAQRAGDLHLVNETGATLQVWAESAQSGERFEGFAIRPGESFRENGSLTYGEEWTICVLPSHVEGIEPHCWVAEPTRGQRVYSWDVFDTDFTTSAGNQVSDLLDPPSIAERYQDEPAFPSVDAEQLEILEPGIRLELAARCPDDDLEYKFRSLRGIIHNPESSYPYCFEGDCWEEGRKTLLFGSTEKLYWTPPGYWTYDGTNLYIWGERDEGSDGNQEWLGCP